MGKLKKLQDQYLKGEITKAQYEAEVKKLLDEEILDQDTYDTALEYDPEAEKPQFTQADVDRMVAARATKMVKKALKDAGVDLEGVQNKDLLPKVTELLKGKKDDGQGDGKPNADVEKWKTAATTASAKLKDVTIENAVLKAAGKYNPVNVVQVVRALKADYMDLVEIDDENGVDAKTVDLALKRMFTAEPNLFKQDDGNGGEGNGGTGGGYKGKGPGGGAGGDDKGGEMAKKKAEAMALMGITQPNQN